MGRSTGQAMPQKLKAGIPLQATISESLLREQMDAILLQPLGTAQTIYSVSPVHKHFSFTYSSRGGKEKFVE